MTKNFSTVWFTNISISVEKEMIFLNVRVSKKEVIAGIAGMSMELVCSTVKTEYVPEFTSVLNCVLHRFISFYNCSGKAHKYKFR